MTKARDWLTVTIMTVAIFAFIQPAALAANWGWPMEFGHEQASTPIGVALDSAGHVYVGNLFFVGNDEYDAGGKLVSPPSPFPSAGGTYSGTAVNPVDGDIDVVNAAEQAIDVFSPTNDALLSSFSISGTANLFGAYTAVQIATDAHGNIYVPSAPQNEIKVFGATGGSPTGSVASIITGSGANELSAPEGVAVAASGDLLVANSGAGRIEEFELDGTFVRGYSASGVQAVATDTKGDVFASIRSGSGTYVVEYNSAGQEIDSFGQGVLLESGFGTPNAVVVNSSLGLVYVANGGSSVIDRFATWGARTHPATQVTESRVNVNGLVEIEPGSEPITTCRFEYGTTSSYGSSASCVPAGSYSDTTQVSAKLEGLSIGQDYHYRLVAVNKSGVEQAGEDGVFGAPAIESELSSNVGTSTAGVEAKIDPFGTNTSCFVEYVDDESYQLTGYRGATTVPCSPENLGEGVTPKPVKAELTRLLINTKYHFRFVATNSSDRSGMYGNDETFVTFGISSASITALTLNTETMGLEPYMQAAGHPYELTTNLELNKTSIPSGRPDAAEANPRNVVVQLPPGLVGNPNAIAKCAPYNVAHADCSGASQVGILVVYTAGGQVHEVPLYNLVPPEGMAAQFGARFNGYVTAHIDASVRTGGDYGVTASSLYVSAAEGLTAVRVTLWGVPSDPRHDEERRCPASGKINEEGPCYERGPATPFLTEPSACSGRQLVKFEVDSWQDPGTFVGAVTEMPGETGCVHVGFTPTIEVQPESAAAASPTGLRVELHLPQKESVDGLAESDLKNATVTLARGMMINPASAGGLVACSPSQIELGGPAPGKCPETSKIGDVSIETPLLDHPLTGGVYVAQQGNAGPSQGSNPFNSLLAIYVAAYEPQSGVVIKLAGRVSLNATTGQITTTFSEDPQLPFENFKLEFFGGVHASLATPVRCGSYVTTSLLEPFSHSPAEGETEGAPDASPSSQFHIVSGPKDGTCSQISEFTPSVTAGSTNNAAGRFSPFTTTIRRKDGEQPLGTVAMKLPLGVAGELSKVTLCPEAEANAGDCPASSKIGHVIARSGVGKEPITLPEPGKPEDPVYITGPYKGAPFGLSIVVPAEAGPFNLGTVVVRGKINVNPYTSQVSVETEPMPTRLQGIPLDVRDVEVAIDKQGFMFNPTNCEEQHVTGTIGSSEGASENVSSRFQAADCASLPFKLHFSATTHSYHTRRGGAYLGVKITSRAGEANLHRVHVTLPGALPSRLETLKQACTEEQFAANPAGCPEGAFVGSVVANTPVLPVPLTGPAIFVSHGGKGFPNLDFVLQGDGVTEIQEGDTFINKKSVTTSTFPAVPDIPITSIEVKLPEGPHSALAANGNLCRKPLYMPTELAGQNGAVIEKKTRIKVEGCKPAIEVVRSKVKGATAKLVVRVPSAGRLVARGHGIRRVAKRLRKAKTATLKVSLTRRDRRLLAKHPKRSQRVKVRLRFTPKKKNAKPISNHVTVLMK